MSEQANVARAREILRCVEIFNTGCSNAGPLAKHFPQKESGDPTDCPECVEAFLQAINSANSKADGTKPSGPITYTIEKGADVWPFNKSLNAIRCLFGHKWDFRHKAKPPVVVCMRCGRTDPMPYGDARMPYL